MDSLPIENREGVATTAGPLVSITMPTYNRAHLVGEAIDAVLAQTYPHFELILVNDGSRDNTRDVLDGYAARDPRIRVIHKENEGIPDTVNRGWRESRGELVTWTSDDNNYHPTSIAVMVDYLQQHPEVALVYTDSQFIDAEGRVFHHPPGREPDVLDWECPIAGCLLFRRSVFATVDPFRKQWKRCHDFDFYHRVWERFAVARIPQVLYDYRWHSASMTGDHWAMHTEMAACLASYATDGSGRRKAWGWCWDEVGRQALREQRPWKGVWFFGRAAICEPSRWRRWWREFWTTSYNTFIPVPLQHGWRWLKRRGQHVLRRQPRSEAKP